MPERRFFSVWDYALFGITIVASALVGFYHVFANRKKKTTTQDFLMAGRNMGLAPLIMSTIATAISAVGIIGIPVEIYMSGIQFLLQATSTLFTALITIYLYLPIFYNLRLTSVFEYLELRFSRYVRLLASAAYIVITCLYMACVIYAPALAISQVTGIHLELSVVVITVVCMFYTGLGGLKAVIWTDVLQTIIMYGSIFAIVIKGLIDAGGFEKIWKQAEEGNRTNFFHWWPNSESHYTVWSLVIGSTFYFNFLIGCNQTIVQRELSNPTLKAAKWNVIGMMVGWFISLNLIGIIGLLLYSAYQHCDPFESKVIGARDQMLPLYAIDVLSFAKGLPGVFVAGMISASLSSLSSVLNSLATITLEDFILPMKPAMSDSTALKTSKALGIMYGLVCLAAVWALKNLGTVMQALFLVQGAGGGMIAGLFTTGMLIPWVNHWGALCSSVLASGFAIWFAIGVSITNPKRIIAVTSTQGCPNATLPAFNITTPLPLPLPKSTNGDIFPLYTINPLWSATVTTFIVVIVSLVVSVVTGPADPKKLPKGVICSGVETLCKSLPIKLRKALGYGDEEHVKSEAEKNDAKEQKNVAPREECTPRCQRNKITSSAYV